MCPFWSRRRRRELGTSAAAWSGTGRAWQLPRHSCRDGGWRGGLASHSATWVLAPAAPGTPLGKWAALSGHAWPVLHPQLGAPCSASIWVPSCTPGCWGGGGCGTWPLVTPSLHRTPLLLGTFTNYISRFSHFEAALGASWLIATSPIMIGRRASDFQAMADLWLSELANEHGENELFRLT